LGGIKLKVDISIDKKVYIKNVDLEDLKVLYEILKKYRVKMQYKNEKGDD
jgi:hypothetical protein